MKNVPMAPSVKNITCILFWSVQSGCEINPKKRINKTINTGPFHKCSLKNIYIIQATAKGKKNIKPISIGVNSNHPLSFDSPDNYSTVES